MLPELFKGLLQEEEEGEKDVNINNETAITAYVFIIKLNVDGLKALIQRHNVDEKTNPTYTLPPRDNIQIKGTYRLK